MVNFSHWNDIEDYLSTASNQIKGDLFEKLTECYLKWDSKYQVLLKNVWCLKDLPTAVLKKLNIPSQDQGIDLIAETYEGKYWAIQCKFHGDTNKKISHREIATFLALSNSVASNIDFCLVATTADDYAKLYKGQSNIGFILANTWNQLPVSFFENFRKNKIVKPSLRNPRSHQKVAIEDALKYFKSNNRGKLIFPCGAGKSLTGYWITKKLNVKSIIVAVPSLALVKQTLEDYCQESFAEGNPIAPFCICSDEGIGKNDDIAVFTQDMGVVCTTDKSKIKDFLLLQTDRTKVIFTTYQSGRVLGNSVKELNYTFDVGIMDESHKTVGATDKLFSHLLFDENVPIQKRIFMTATERRYKGNSENILSMDDLDVYGETFTQLSFKEAINQEILSDYKILTLVITQSEIKEYLKQNDFVKALGIQLDKDIDFRTLSSLVALRKAMQTFPIKHAVTFHSSIKRAKIFEQLQPLFDHSFPSFGTVDAFHVTGSVPTGQRSKIISEFSQSERSIITNAKCLTEGVDVPNIDCVLFADPRQSSIDIVQAVGRALRRSQGKDFGYVLLPVYAENNDKDSIIESADFQAILQTLRALAANDERIIEYFREKQNSDRKSDKSELIQFEIDEIIGQEISTTNLLNQIELKVWSRLAKLSWRPFEEAREYVQNLNIHSHSSWQQFAKKNLKPIDIPSSPVKVYKEWVSWGDWLGTNRIADNQKEFLDFYEARKISRSLGIKTVLEWVEFCRIKSQPTNIPSTPQIIYKNKGWINWGDWLGTNRNATHLRDLYFYSEAAEIVQNLEIQSMSEFRRFYKINPDYKMPLYPNQVYENKGWINSSTFLNSSKFKRKYEYWAYIKARSFVHKLGLKSLKDWESYKDSNKLPKEIPRNPQITYESKGWIGVQDWLGYEQVQRNLKTINFREFNAAKKFVHNLNLVNKNEWVLYRQGKLYNKPPLPSDIPTNPWREYEDKGWNGIQDWLGVASFLEAKSFARTLKITSKTEWYEWLSKNILPDGIPENPNHIYKGEDWKGWADFLGKEDEN